MGDLARIPWQAARSKDGRYAIELIAISQAASARLLCRSAALSTVKPSSAGLLVGDPNTSGRTRDLPAARLEAFAIRQTFYRGGRYLGRRPDGSNSKSGTGTREQVRAWLATPGLTAGNVLHLACHGLVQAGTDPTAFLMLADGEKLTAQELIACMAQQSDRVIGLVVLAACRSGESMNGYDEAYSLGTAFLAGGARSVLATQWSVDDSATSVMMFMFHYFLRSAGMSTWAGLRAAQLWMLNPGRVIPDEMPHPLRRQIDVERMANVVAWAPFVHWGQ
jgi:CHAT domain-containing protein